MLLPLLGICSALERGNKQFLILWISSHWKWLPQEGTATPCMRRGELLSYSLCSPCTCSSQVSAVPLDAWRVAYWYCSLSSGSLEEPDAQLHTQPECSLPATGC